MAIKGSLREAALPDVIQLLFLGRRTGCLAVADRQSHASVFFENGWVIHATIVNRRDRLGDMLVKSGRMSREQLDQAIQMQGMAHGRRLGGILVELGAISGEELAAAVHRQVEEAVYTLFTWTSGSFSFEPGVEPDPDVDRVRIPPDALLLEGARRVDEWSLIEKKIPTFDLVFARDRSQDGMPDLEYSEAQDRILPLIDGRRDVRSLIDDTGLSEYDTCQALYGLLTAGLIHRVGTTIAPPAGRSIDMQIDEHRNLGIAFYRTAMLDEASREFRRVAELRPSEGQAPFFLGLIAARQGRWSEAASFFRHAADKAGPRPSIVHNLGVALGEAGEPEQAESRLADAAGRTPNDPRVQLAWGVLALERGEAELAVVRLTRARELWGDTVPATWYWATARAQSQAGDLERALTVAREGVARYPQQPVLLNNLAVFLETSGDLAGAEDVLAQALGESPSLPQISKNLGDIYYRLGRFDDAWEAYQRASRLQPDLGDDLYFKLGNLALKRGDRPGAATHWNRALELNPRHQLARANLQTVASE